MFPRCPEPAVLVADLGGTKTAAGVVLADDSVLARHTVPTPSADGSGAVLAALIGVLQSVRDEVTAMAEAPEIAGVGIASAGVIDRLTGTVTSATDAISGWAGTPLRAEMEQAFHLPAAVLNDVHAHALGESTVGAGRGASSMLMAAVGTGIGGAHVLEGSVLPGARGVAGSIGHVPVPEAEGILCSCGRLGHAEAIGSGPGLLRAYRKAGGLARSTRDVFLAMAEGSTVAEQCVRRSATAVGRAVGGLLNVVDPHLVVLSGGMAAAGATWWQAVREGVALEAMDAVADTPIVPAVLGGDAPLLGAAQALRDREGWAGASGANGASGMGNTGGTP